MAYPLPECINNGQHNIAETDGGTRCTRCGNEWDKNGEWVRKNPPGPTEPIVYPNAD